MRPFELTAPLKDYIWGGTRLRDEFGKQSGLPRIAESWELSCHRDGKSVIASGEYKGMTLAELIDKHPEICGRACSSAEDFPVLVKLIDAKNDLSVQVHPDDAYAKRIENSFGKTEMWYIVDCDEGAELIYGFRKSISREEFRRAVEDNTFLEYVNRVPVKKGDVFFIPPGTLHAIGKGIVLDDNFLLFLTCHKGICSRCLYRREIHDLTNFLGKRRYRGTYSLSCPYLLALGILQSK